MDAVKFYKEQSRMCKTYNKCPECPIYELMDNGKLLCITALHEKLEEFVDLVETWSKEHPIMTNKMKFEEVFGETCDENGEIVLVRPSWWFDEYHEPNGKETYQLIKGCLEGQDGNQGYTEEVVGVFTFLEDAIDSYNQRQHNGWLSYSVKNMKTGRILELPMKGE